MRRRRFPNRELARSSASDIGIMGVEPTGSGLPVNRVESFFRLSFIVILLGFLVTPMLVIGQGEPVRGSIVEDRAAKKLLEAGDARLEAEETEKAVEIWRSVIERYPGSRMRFDAHMRLGDFLLENKSAFDEARGHFESVDVEGNANSEQRAEAALKTGICFYEGRHYGHSFKVLRGVIEDFPSSGEVNSAYYYIGLGHFKLGHYSRAIEALEKVGTALTGEDAAIEKVEAGKRLYVKVGDQDLAVLEPGETIQITCQTTAGDIEEVIHPVGSVSDLFLPFCVATYSNALRTIIYCLLQPLNLFIQQLFCTMMLWTKVKHDEV